MAVDSSRILLPPEEPDFRIYERPWPNTLFAEDLNVADYLNRKERHHESLTEPDRSFDDSWRVDQDSRWLLKDGEIIASYYIEENKTRALLGTYLEPDVPLAVQKPDGAVEKYESISLWINVKGFKGGKFIVRLNSNSLSIAAVECDPRAEGQLSADLKWKRIVMSFTNEKMKRTIREMEYFNKIEMVVEKPGGAATLQGTIHVKGVQLHLATADDVSRRVMDVPPGKSASLRRG